MGQYLGVYLRLYVCEEVLFSRVWQLAEQVRWDVYGVQQCIIPSQGGRHMCQSRRHLAGPEPSSTYVSLTGGEVSSDA